MKIKLLSLGLLWAFTASALDGGIYTIKWKNNTESYMTEAADGGIVIGNYNPSNKVFWEFVPTDREHCFYIRNVATGRYIGSSNMTPSSDSKVRMSDTPVEYYVHISSATAGDIAGCYWMASTDCPVYDKESADTRALNKDGASSSIIAWKAATTNTGSFWKLVKTENAYEVKPFTTNVPYHMLNTDCKAYNNDGTWVAFSPTSKEQQWRFLGESNADGGYQIVNEASGAALNGGAKYKVSDNYGSAPYRFEGSGLGDITFTAARSRFALDNHIYTMPCGTVGKVYIRKATIGEDFHYPMATKGSSKITYSTASLPADKYVMLTRDAAIVTPGAEVPVTISTNRIDETYSVFMYADWDCDGYFETALQSLPADTKEFETRFSVPADAKPGKTRLRIRITDNGLAGADDAVNGEVLDLMLNVVNPSEAIAPEVTVNAPDRGSAEWADGIAKAVAKGNASFICWKEGYRIVSLDAEYAVAASGVKRTLTAFFSPKTKDLDGIDEVILNAKDSNAKIIYNAGTITIESQAKVLAIVVYSTDGARMAGTNRTSLSTSSLPGGVYIVKAVTSNGITSSKIKI